MMAAGAFLGPVLAGPGDHVAAATVIPRYDHVVVVPFENHDYGDILDTAPYFKSLAAQGALFTQSFGVTHPSQPNYISLFSGSPQGVTDDSCPHSFTGGNLGQQLIDAGHTFKAYSEDLPSAGYTGCSSGDYARKHAPWTDFPTVRDSSHHLPFSSFPTDYTKLPTVSFVVPDLCSDMHNCSVSTGDSWLKSNLDGYAQWAKTHNSLLIVTFDEDSRTSSVNQIYTAFVGAHVKTGYQSNTQINHFNVLRTIEDMYGLPALGNAARKTAVTDVWSVPGGPALFSDDFESDKGWRVNTTGTDTATSGLWQRGNPEETVSDSSGDIKQLGTTHSGTNALTTGLLAGDSYASDDVDDGITSVTSPAITLPTGTTPQMSWWYNFAYNSKSGPDDYLRVEVVSGTASTTVFQQNGTADTRLAGAWRAANADLSAFAGKTVRLRITAADMGASSVVEAQIDDLTVTSS
ncbi:alkaline phosphatase family protein [Kitasatospora sp. NPDC092039]|uniref:alkaline phosphatase family protein n=1 Tax=Kitasatospora sp. NPDC092039 TaxID=3364086 RepID=UPI00382BB75F